MLGIFVQLIISWLLIWLFEKNDLKVLGFFPTKKRLSDFALFFFITALCCSTEFLMKIFLAHQQWKINPVFTGELLWEGIRWNMVSVLFEELIFRGAILYILIKRLGISKAVIISAIGFGIYHWFSYGIIGNIPQMAIIFIITGIMGLVLAYGYAKTLSLYIPIAIHFGWNFTHMFIFSNGTIGKGLFMPVNPEPFRTNSYLLFFAVMLVPMISTLFLNYMLLRKRKQVELTTYDRYYTSSPGV